MARIRKPRYLDKYKLKKMIAFLGSDAIDQYTKVFMNFPFNALHGFIPLKYKFLPESYVLVEGDDIIGMITVSPTPGNPFRINISRLFLEQNYYNSGKQLIEFVIAKYGAKGANSFVASIDDSHNELLSLFIEGCGFRQCSCEQLWKMNTLHFENENTSFFRPFKNSDAQAVAMLFNDSVITHFKHSVSRMKDEYLDPVFGGLTSSYKIKYVIEDENLKTIKAYFSLTTGDNFNYILDITASQWYEYSYEDILNFAVTQISRRKKDFCLFVKVKKYSANAESLESFLTDKGFNCVQNQLVLVKDFYKVINEHQAALKIVLFNDIKENPVFKI